MEQDKGISIVANFDLHSPFPLDSRICVNQKSVIDTLIANNWVYEGMVIYVLNDSYYQIYTTPEGALSYRPAIVVTGDVINANLQGNTLNLQLTRLVHDVDGQTFTKFQCNEQGRIVSASTLEKSDIPNIDASQVNESADKHFVTEDQATALNNTNQANGYIKADGEGYIPDSAINPIKLAVSVDYPNIDAMLAGTELGEGVMCFVEDATGDTTVSSGWAIYRRKVGTGEKPTLALEDFTKIQEQESMDISLVWSAILQKPGTFPPSAHNQASSTITSLSGYTKAEKYTAISSDDNLNTAIGKLEAFASGGGNIYIGAGTITTKPPQPNQNPVATIPLPDGYTRNQCKYCIWIQRFHLSGSSDFMYQSVNQSTGVITAYYNYYDSEQGNTKNSVTVEYLVIATK